MKPSTKKNWTYAGYRLLVFFWMYLTVKGMHTHTQYDWPWFLILAVALFFLFTEAQIVIGAFEKIKDMEKRIKALEEQVKTNQNTHAQSQNHSDSPNDLP